MEAPLDRLIFAILPDVNADRLLSQLAAFGFRATRIASAGGYLRSSNSTLLIGLPASRVAECLGVLRALCEPAAGASAGYPSPEMTELYASGFTQVVAGAGIAFVARVETFERICE